MKKGFTVVEMLVSFSVATIVMVLLFNVIMLIKDLYTDYGIKTELLIKQSNILKSIEVVTNDELTKVTACGIDCYNLEAGGKTYNLKYNELDNSITFNNKKTIYKGETTKIKGISATTNTTTKESTDPNIKNSILNLKIIIYDNLLDENYDINFNYLYNDNYMQTNFSLDTN